MDINIFKNLGPNTKGSNENVEDLGPNDKGSSENVKDSFQWERKSKTYLDEYFYQWWNEKVVNDALYLWLEASSDIGQSPGSFLQSNKQTINKQKKQR